MNFNGNVTSRNNPSAGGRGATFAHSFADFLLGRFDTYGQGDGFDQTLQSWNLGLYVMDTWRVTPRLTVTPGLRLEVNSGISEIENRLTLYRPGLQSTTYPNFPDGRRGRRRRRPARQLLGHVHQARPSPQLRLRRVRRRQDGRARVGRASTTAAT